MTGGLGLDWSLIGDAIQSRRGSMDRGFLRSSTAQSRHPHSLEPQPSSYSDSTVNNSMETPPSGMFSPPASPHMGVGTPSSLISDFPSLSGSNDFFSDDDDHSLNRSKIYANRTHAFTSHEHPDATSHLILPSGLGLAVHVTESPSPYAAHSTSSLALQNTLTQENHNLPISSDPPSKILVIGRRGCGKSAICDALLSPSADPSSTSTPAESQLQLHRVGDWVDAEEPSPDAVLEAVLEIVRKPFRDLEGVFNAHALESSVAAVGMLASGASPLYTAAILVLSNPPTSVELLLLRDLAHSIPVIPYTPRHHPSHSHLLRRIDSRSSSRYASPHHSPYLGSVHRLSTFPSPTQFHATSIHTLRAHLHPSLLRLRIEAAGKFIAYEARRRIVDAHVHIPETSSPLIPVSAHMKLPSDPFERFAFDALFTQSDAEDLEDGLMGRIAGAPATDVEEERGQEEVVVEKWETDLSKLVALRKREVLDRRDTFRGAVEERDTFRGRLEQRDTFRGRMGLESLRIRQPLPALEVDTPGYTSETGGSPMPADTPAYTASPILSSRSRSRSRTLTVTDAEDNDADPSEFDPLHLPSILNLLVSLIRDRLRRIFLSPPPGGLPSYITDMDTPNEKFEEDWREEKEKEPLRLTLPVVGVLCAAAAASGYWAGVTRGGGSVGLIGMF